jgi:FkbM family methyltransferase
MNVSSFVPRLKPFVLNGINRLRKRLLGPNVQALLVSSQNGLFLVDVEDLYVGRHLAAEGEYGLAEIDRLKQHVDRAVNLLVVGGHIGTVAIPISQHCHSVTVIEANPRTFRLLRLNVLANECANVRVIHTAASDKEEEIQFVMSRVNTGGSKRMPLKRDAMYFYDSPETVTVGADRLDDLLDGERFNVVFMDIEGSEYFALGGMQTILTFAKVLFMEFVPHHLRNVSGVSVDRLLERISPHFSTLFVPSKGITVSRDRFGGVLQEMFDHEQSDDGIVFTK